METNRCGSIQHLCHRQHGLDPVLGERRLWADEPTGNLDSTNAGEIMELLKRFNREQEQTFVLVTHSDEVGSMADRVVRMSDGVIVDDGNGVITKTPRWKKRVEERLVGETVWR